MCGGGFGFLDNSKEPASGKEKQKKPIAPYNRAE